MTKKTSAKKKTIQKSKDASKNLKKKENALIASSKNQQNKKGNQDKTNRSTEVEGGKKTFHPKIEQLSINGQENPYLEELQLATSTKAPPGFKHLLGNKINEEQRCNILNDLDLDLMEKYSWACPNERALKVIKEFGPVIEMGAGKGYWTCLLKKRGVDIIAFDHKPPPVTWGEVKKGTPALLKNHKNRTLLLCYPDDFEDSDSSMALECLDVYKGDTIITIGEFLGQTVMENPFGRSIGADAQAELCAGFHLIFRIPLPSFPTNVDSLSVWKRTKTVKAEDMEFKSIPDDEKVGIVLCCPKTKHLLK